MMKFSEDILQHYGIERVRCIKSGNGGQYWWKIHTTRFCTENEIMEFCQKYLKRNGNSMADWIQALKGSARWWAGYGDLKLSEGVWSYLVFVPEG